GTDDPFTLDGAADSHVRPEVLTVGVEHIELTGLGPEDHQFFAEVVGPFHPARGELGGESGDEPPRREPIRRETDAAWPEFTLRRICAVRNHLRHCSLRPHSQQGRSPNLSVAYFYYFRHSRSRSTKRGCGCPPRFRSTCQILRCGRTVFPTICSWSCAATGRSFTTS